jgi:hypothetical protein
MKRKSKALAPVKAARQGQLGASSLNIAAGVFPARLFVVHVAPASLATNASRTHAGVAESRARRRALGALLRLLRALPGVACVERGGPDRTDAFLLPAGAAAGAFGNENLAANAALALAEQACAAAAQQLGLALAASVAPNKLLARLASRAAAPAGISAIVNASLAADMLATTPAAALPGADTLAEPLAAAGLDTAGAVALVSPASLALLLGCTHAAAAALHASARGVCPHGSVASTVPPGNMSKSCDPSPFEADAEMSLVPTQPERLATAFATLGAELAADVVDDAAEWHRWPTKLALTADCEPPLPRNRSRELRFPPPPLGWPPRAPPSGAPPLLDAAAEAELGAAIAAACAAAFARACGSGPPRRVSHLMLLATRLEAVVAPAETPPLSALFPTVHSPAKRLREEREDAAAPGDRPLDVPAMLRALAEGRISPGDVRAAVDAAEQRVARQRETAGPAD